MTYSAAIAKKPSGSSRDGPRLSVDIMGSEQIEILVQQLDRIEATLTQLVQQRVAQEWYSTTEAAQLLERDPFTVREWARHGRIRAEKRKSGRGKHLAWTISHEELLRIRREGLLPLKR
jgi:hypothetical protein